jgi:hypothetical protein
MYNSDTIEQLFGPAVLEYLNNKHRGGTSGAKGNTYENFFAVYQLALLAEAAITDSTPIHLRSQAFAFVDDLIIDRNDSSPLEHFQLKDSSNVRWGNGLRSIADDFEKQHQLNQAQARDSRLNLVVSDPIVSKRLETNLPGNLVGFSQVQYFPSDASLANVLAQEPNFCQAIRYLCSIEQPGADKLECVAKVLLGAWVSCNQGNATVMELLRAAQACTPSYIRTFAEIDETDQEFLKILNKIPNFTYNFAKGFFHWQYAKGLDEGDFPCSIDTDQFRRFKERVKQLKPTTFEALETLLL